MFTTNAHFNSEIRKNVFFQSEKKKDLSFLINIVHLSNPILFKFNTAAFLKTIHFCSNLRRSQNIQNFLSTHKNRSFRLLHNSLRCHPEEKIRLQS